MSIAIAKAIREALKAAGYKRDSVSVYNQSYSMGSTVYVTVKRPEVALQRIAAIADPFAIVHRDDASGEILSGGNTFVECRYADGLLDGHAARIDAQVAAGRYRFGSLELNIVDAFTLRIWRRDGPGLHVDRKSPGGVLARELAAIGELRAIDGCAPREHVDDLDDPGRCMHCQAPMPPANDAAAAPPAEDVEALIVRAREVAREMFGEPRLEPLPRRDGESDGEYTQRLVRAVVRAAERWKLAVPCPPRGEDARLHALWCAVERLVAHDEGREPALDGDLPAPH